MDSKEFHIFMKSSELALILSFFIIKNTQEKRHSRPGHDCRLLAETPLLTQSHTKWFPKYTHFLPHENLSQNVLQYVAFLQGCNSRETLEEEIEP